MKKTLAIIITGLSLIYGPGIFARSCQKQDDIAQVIWEHYCKNHGIDPENPTPEQKEEYLDIYCETDEYCELYKSLTELRGYLTNN